MTKTHETTDCEASTCGCAEDVNFEGLSSDYKRRLSAVIALNASMFAVEMGGGVIAGSQALQADALDFLGDTSTYGIASRSSDCRYGCGRRQH